MASKGWNSLPPLPPGWEECRTEAGEVYYQDHNRGITQWERPAPASQPTPQPRQPMRSSAPAARATSPPLPAGWTKGRTTSGEVYFIDHNTKTSTWDDPRTTRPAASAPAAPAASRPSYRPEAERPSRGPPRSAPQFEDHRRKEQELMRQKREIEAEKARIEAQLRMEDELRRKASDLERRRLEIEREKAEVARMKAELQRTLQHAPDPYVPARAGARSAPPRYATRQYDEAPRTYAPPPPRTPRGTPRGGGPPPRYATVRPAPPAPSRRPAEASASVPMPWTCAECATENTTNKFRCKSCSAPRADIPPPVESAKPARPPRAAGPKGGERTEDDRAKKLRPCRFGADCRRPDCAFGHPEMMPIGRKPCRYGETCNKPDCSFGHLVLVSRRPEYAGPRPVKPRKAEDLQFPDGMAPEVAEKVRELYRNGVELNQKTIELLGQLEVPGAIDCLDATMNDGTSNKVEMLKSLIEIQLSGASSTVVSREEVGAPPQKRAKTE